MSEAFARLLSLIERTLEPEADPEEEDVPALCVRGDWSTRSHNGHQEL